MELSLSEVLSVDNPIIVDVRDKYSFSLGHIPGAINIAYYNLLANYSHYLNKYDTYYLYCDYGKQSEEISERLNSFGYKTYNIIGGYEKYLERM